MTDSNINTNIPVEVVKDVNNDNMVASQSQLLKLDDKSHRPESQVEESVGGPLNGEFEYLGESVDSDDSFGTLSE